MPDGPKRLVTIKTRILGYSQFRLIVIFTMKHAFHVRDRESISNNFSLQIEFYLTRVEILIKLVKGPLKVSELVKIFLSGGTFWAFHFKQRDINVRFY